jgi:hypothetical protein
LATTISNTIAIIAIAVCSTIKVSLIVLSFRAHHACHGRRVGVQQVVAPSPVPTEQPYRKGHGPRISPIPGCIFCSLNEGVKVTCCRSGLRKSSSPWLQRAAGNRTTPSVSDLWSTASTSETGTRIDPYACRCEKPVELPERTSGPDQREWQPSPRELPSRSTYASNDCAHGRSKGQLRTAIIY